jgi:glycine/D-amino acid oxidase-like deaminating enzyme
MPHADTTPKTTSGEQLAAESWRQRSLWLEGIPEPLRQRPGLAGRLDCDVAIVGAGFTGLWTAYYLKRHQPDLRVAVIEREIAGFGASGRNGGWVSSGIAGSLKAYGCATDSARARAAQRETFATVDEIGAVVDRERIDCGFQKDGMLTIATTVPQQRRLAALLAASRGAGLGDDDLRPVPGAELRGVISLPGPVSAAFSPHGARINPARLVRGLADAAERAGVALLEGTEATEITSRRVDCTTGTIHAEHVVSATEAFTIGLEGESRRYLPLYSLMIATEPLAPEVWARIGWRDAVLIRDSRHLFFYAQRTTDGRIAIGGRGAPYPWGSPITTSSEQNAKVRRRLVAALTRHFPAAADAEITHHWGGALAVPRDWSMSVGHDRRTGLARAGGYSGHGVVASNISGRTLADLILGRDTPLVSMPWVAHTARRWEPEPLRFLASRAIVRTLEGADRYEDRSNRRARRELLVRPFMPPG